MNGRRKLLLIRPGRPASELPAWLPWVSIVVLGAIAVAGAALGYVLRAWAMG